MKKSVKIAIGCAVLVVLIVLFVVIFAVTRPAVSEGDKTITVTVVHSDESSVTYTYATDEEYLGTVLVDEGLIEGDVTEYGLYINTVDGETADYSVDNSYWALYEGEDYAMQGVDTTPIYDGSSYSLIYTYG